MHKGKTTALTYDLDEMDLDAVCHLIGASYWGATLKRDRMMKSFRFSSCVGVFYAQQQIAFGRAISDRCTSAYLKDIVVRDGFRRNGHGRRVMHGLFNHPDLQNVPSWYLGTQDAHAFYRSFGFKTAPDGIYMYRHT